MVVVAAAAVVAVAVEALVGGRLVIIGMRLWGLHPIP